MHESFKALLPLIIPEGVSDYFQLTDHKKDTSGIHIYLEEINSTPVEYKTSKGSSGILGGYNEKLFFCGELITRKKSNPCKIHTYS
ncbi:hypothetical protein [Arcticibacter tournemirensis]